jgi:hypothetical protein
MAIALNLIGENCQYDTRDYEFIKESENSGAPKTLYIKGPFTEANRRNRNQRIYPLEELSQQINEFNENYVTRNRAYGELEHPEYPQINLKNACHMITELKQDGNIFYGKSKILPTETGKTVEIIIEAGGTVGVSSRSLGSVDPKTGIVSNLRLCTFDIVSDPSSQSAFVEGILESKQWYCNKDNRFEEVYENLENSLINLPRHEVDKYLCEQIKEFLRKLH